MDDALQSQLDRLTWLVGALLLAVLGIGFTLAGAEYLVVLFVLAVFVVVGGTVVVSLAPLFTSDREPAADGGD
jgi:predicted membrane channel-forming protein YqfA (hemolysin III family)